MLFGRALVLDKEVQNTDNSSRQNGAVISQPAKVFTVIIQALEAETLQGQTADRIVEAAKRLVQLTNLDINQLASNMTSEMQQTVRAYFS